MFFSVLFVHTDKKDGKNVSKKTVFLLLLCISVLYGVATFVVLQYQKQSYKNMRNSVLSNVAVLKYFRERHDIDLSGRKFSKNIIFLVGLD